MTDITLKFLIFCLIVSVYVASDVKEMTLKLPSLNFGLGEP